jgi:hypothetical protein
MSGGESQQTDCWVTSTLACRTAWQALFNSARLAPFNKHPRMTLQRAPAPNQLSEALQVKQTPLLSEDIPGP